MGFRKKQTKRPVIRQNLGIYIHVPFCRQKCAYCDFYSRSGCGEPMMDQYCQAIKQHFSDYFHGNSPYDIDTVYFGGGTPSLLGAKRLCGLLEALADKACLRADAEITVECNPESVDLKFFKKLKKAGFNRVSLGVQSSDDGELALLGRLHTFAQAQQAVEHARQAGFDNISLDLMYGLPGQTMERWQQSVEDILALKPQHISAYALKLEEGTPWPRAARCCPMTTPRPTSIFTRCSGWKKPVMPNMRSPILPSPAAAPATTAGYWDLSQYLGFGPAAHSFFGGKRFAFVADTQAYIDGVQGKGELLAEADEVASFRRPGEYIMLKLRTVDGIDEEEFYRRFHMDFAPYGQRLRKYVEPGYCLYENGVWRLTPKGFFVSNAILVDLLPSAE